MSTAAFVQDSHEYWLSTLGDAQPLYCTMPTPGAPNELAQVELVAAAMGTPLTPMQRFITRVVTEKLPSGRYRYPLALISVPRQCGKSALLSAIGVMRLLKTGDTDLFYMAQKGKDGREQIEKTYKQILKSPFAEKAHHRKSNDNAQIELDNGSNFRFAVPAEESLHGKTFPWFLWDELFAFDEERAEKIMGAAGPAQQVRKDRQTIMVSTKGTKASTYLNKQIRKGRAATASPNAKMAYFEWGLAEGLDANDPANWKFHPGLQAGLITEEELEEFADQLSKGEFERAFMNRMTATVTSVLDVNKWGQAFGVPLGSPRRHEVRVGWELGHDEKSAAVVVAWREPDGKIGLKVIRAGDGAKWLPGLLRELNVAGFELVADKYPPNQMIADNFAADMYGISLRLLRTDEFKTASVTFKTMVEDGMIRHDGNVLMGDAIATAHTRRVGEGYLFSHEHCDPLLLASISAVRAVTEQRVQESAEILVAP